MATAEAGFTLMEMLVVLVVIGLIASVAVPQVMKLLGGAKHRAAEIQLETVGHGLAMFQLDTGAYPTAAQGLDALLTAPADVTSWNGPYVKGAKQLSDPWGRKLTYDAEAQGGYALGTLGADGQAGGSGDDADLSAKP